MTGLYLDIGGGFAIRCFQDGDTVSLARYANNRSVWLNLRDHFPHPYTEADAREWIRMAGGSLPQTSFALTDGREAIGGIGLHPQEDVHRLTAEIGYWLGEPFWGRGITTRAVVALTEYGFDRLRLVRIFAGVFEGNRASCRVLEKAGYRREGVLRRNVIKDGKILDQILYARLREETL